MITHLNLQNTQIRDAGAQQLAEALRTNRVRFIRLILHL